MKWALAMVGVLGVLLFVGGPDGESGRLHKEFWDLGHVPLFAGLVFVALQLKSLNRHAWPVLLLGCVMFSLLLGLMVEWIQLHVGRNFEVKDLFSDVLGGVMGLLGYGVLREKLKPGARIGAALGILLLGMVALVPVTLAAADAWMMREDYPVLGDFETPFERERWDTNLARLEVTGDVVRFGHKAMKVTLLAGEYPDVTLKELSPEWSEFKSLRFSVYNTLNVPLPMVLKIYDREHVHNGYEHSDRFNREIDMQPGWNDIEVRMQDVFEAPRNREMNLHEIKSLSLFVEYLEVPVVIYVDGVRLSSK